MSKVGCKKCQEITENQPQITPDFSLQPHTDSASKACFYLQKDSHAESVVG